MLPIDDPFSNTIVFVSAHQVHKDAAIKVDTHRREPDSLSLDFGRL